MPNADGQTERLLAMPDLVYLTGLGERTLRRWLTTGQFPPADFRLGGKHLRWCRETVDAWLADQAVPTRPRRSPTDRLVLLEKTRSKR